jgi:hypothetical protein
MAVCETAVAGIFSRPFVVGRAAGVLGLALAVAGRVAAALAVALAVGVLVAVLLGPALSHAPMVSTIIAAPAARRKAA